MEANRDWVLSMEGRINQQPKLLGKLSGNESCCIFRVPQSLVQMNQIAYQPQIVSIGPYHHGKQHLNMIQEHKWRFLGAFLDQIRERGAGLNSLFQAIAPMEQRIRECYSETIELDSRELIEMMILDGCFVIQLFCIIGRLVAHTNLDDPIFNMAWILTFLMRDLLKLENQIPYFVLETLFEQSIVCSRDDNAPSLPILTLGFFNHLVQRPVEILERLIDLSGNHLLDLFRLSFIPSSPHKQLPSSQNVSLIPSARKLHQAGIKFKSRQSCGSFLDIKFANGVLKIPLFTIDDFSSSFLLNCVAFEQCYYHCSNHFTAYVTFLGCLINTPADAGFLSDHKIIENYCGTDEEVARFFNNVGKDVVFDIHRSYLRKMFKDVNEYYSNDWHVQWAGFKHTYFNTPWSFMSALAALILLIFTLIQSFFAVYAYIYPPKNAKN